MSLFATLGDIEFKVIEGPVSFETKYGAIFAEHQLINRKASLQATGQALDEMTLGIELHSSFCNPGEILKALNDHKSKYSTLPFVFANGEYKGVFVITELAENMEHLGPDGTRIAIGLNITLKEYTGDPAKPNPPGVIKPNAPNIAALQTIEIPNLATPDSLMSSVQNALDTVAKVADAAGKVNSIVQKAQDGDVLGAIGVAGAYAPELTAMAAQLPVEEFQDLEGVATMAVDAGQAANALAQTRNQLGNASALLSSANGLSGLSSASNSIQGAVTSAAAAAPALARLEAVGRVGSRLSGVAL